jgi:hypothetical protein
MSTASWKEKWKSINSKFATCTKECVTEYHSDHKCKDSIEAVIADIWNLKDWLVNDTSTGVSRRDIEKLLESPQAFNLRACGDLETRTKHLRVDDPRRENTQLVWKGNHRHPSGLPVIFSVTRVYKDNPGNEDHWEDAFELARRAIEEWRAFLTGKGLL